MLNKVIEIQSREWFDRSGGNTYFSASVRLWDGANFADSVAYQLPLQYGHDSAARFTALGELAKLGVIPSAREHELRDAGILVIFTKSTRPKRDLMTVKNCEDLGMPRVAPNVPMFIAS
jgi:hypothetical protein